MPAEGGSTERPAMAPEGLYQRYFEDMPCYLSVHDREFRIIDGNRRFRRHFGERQWRP